MYIQIVNNITLFASELFMCEYRNKIWNDKNLSQNAESTSHTNLADSNNGYFIGGRCITFSDFMKQLLFNWCHLCENKKQNKTNKSKITIVYVCFDAISYLRQCVVITKKAQVRHRQKQRLRQRRWRLHAMIQLHCDVTSVIHSTIVRALYFNNRMFSNGDAMYCSLHAVSASCLMLFYSVSIRVFFFRSSTETRERSICMRIVSKSIWKLKMRLVLFLSFSVHQTMERATNRWHRNVF